MCDIAKDHTVFSLFSMENASADSVLYLLVPGLLTFLFQQVFLSLYVYKEKCC